MAQDIYNQMVINSTNPQHRFINRGIYAASFSSTQLKEEDDKLSIDVIDANLAGSIRGFLL